MHTWHLRACSVSHEEWSSHDAIEGRREMVQLRWDRMEFSKIVEPKGSSFWIDLLTFTLI